MPSFPPFNPDPNTQQQFMNQVSAAIQDLEAKVEGLRNDLAEINSKLKVQQINNTVLPDKSVV